MNALAKLRLSLRMQLLVGLTLLGLLTLCVTSLFQLRETMTGDRMQKTRNLVEVGLGVVAHFHDLAASGKLSDGEAREAAKAALRQLRYDTQDYYFIIDTTHHYVMMPPKPENEGKDMSSGQDANGKYLFRDLVATGVAGGGFVDYWFPRAGENKPSPKLSYTKLFAPWGWVVGTGIYIDDVNREFAKSGYLLGGISLALLAALSVIGYLIASSIIRQLGGEPAEALTVMQRVAGGDLTATTAASQPGSLLQSLDTMVAALRGIIAEINRDADRLVANAEQIATASDEVAKAAEQQSDATSAMAAAIEQLTVSSNHISESASETSADSRQALTLSSEGGERVNQARNAINAVSETVTGVASRIVTLEDQAKQISTIANVIKEIAGQTNLLALNAAIEAARAGEQGRGFAVVADEVGKLAERTAGATTEIEQMIAAIQTDTSSAVEAMKAALPEVERGVSLAESATASLHAIEDGARRTLGRVGEVADATREQSAASTSIAQRVEQIANMVEETTATIRGTTENAHQLESIASNLKRLIGRFRI